MLPVGHEMIHIRLKSLIVLGSKMGINSWTTMYSRHSGGFLAKSVFNRIVRACKLQLPQSALNILKKMPSSRFRSGRRRKRPGHDAGDWQSDAKHQAGTPVSTDETVSFST